ncbi:YcxB family protein [Acinetobacter sp. CAAS 2-6]|uniref:YcxB family protein n=1 Tax=Acinetobacter sp. CAAS 2-6 TaxID=3016358 RepID=UPI002DD6B05C|nr:YcxB family protein [Acinetobacter sp. CAAS 2-6]
MTDQQPALALRYQLNLEESQDGFALAAFGKKQFTRFMTPLISIGIMLWGIYLGFAGVGRYYVALGAFFLVLQAVMRYWFLPMVFKRQFVKYQLGKSEQGIELFQDHVELYVNGRKQVFAYSAVRHFASSDLTYMIEFNNRMVVIVPKRAFANAADKSLFENTFKK